MQFKSIRLLNACDVYQPKTIAIKYFVPDGKYTVYGANGEIGQYDEYNHEEPEVLMACRGATCGTINVSKPFSWINGNAMVIHPNGTVPLRKDYLKYYLMSVSKDSIISGTAQPQITRQNLKDFQIVICDLDDQQKIVSQIEESLSQLNNAVETLNKTKQQLEIYRQAVLRKCFDCGYETRKLKELCFFITKGTTPAKKELFSGHGEIPFVKVYNLTFSNKLDFSIDPTFVSNATHKGFLKRSITYPGDVLMNIVGPPMGKVSIVPHDYPEWNINQAIARFRCGEKLNNKFLAYYLGFSDTIKKLKSKSKATAGQFNLTLEICREIEIPLPNIEEQQRIADEIDNRLCICDIIIDTINQSLQQAEALRQSILKQAFEEGQNVQR